ncbi:2-polyprenylphenol hydroxylase and related flavodoxin oxidoreductases / CDP-6-deoxy-delta-3,4-glucoseen reductase-like [hydrothermal vent metagenome]|uniref:2-polyprenylphenol hydroxylase and related flavodoxin oxidoreductases / CDP-6-deoxy-delta-3,4-glucoseen reductase-like n=1 Tax=hydrothermal vent metagenome TaxID=652676 RepID=A0A3B0ZD14_9ZZZZ
MSHTITLLPSNHSFTLEGSTSILETALEKGLNLNYGCTNGKCGKCRAQVKIGKVEKIKHQDFNFTAAEKNKNIILMCTCTATSDLVIEADLANNDIDIPYQEIKAKLKKINSITDYTSIIHLQTPRTNTLRFLAGQNINLIVNNQSACYPIASCPCDDRNLEFHINSKNNSEFSNQLLNNTNTGASIELNGPYGKFKLQETPQMPTIFFVVDSGFAPIKSLIEHAISLDYEEKLILFLFSTHNTKHYYHNLCRSWDDALDNFTYMPITIELKSLNEKYYDLEVHNQNLIINHFLNAVSNKCQSPEQFHYYLSAGKNTIDQMILKLSTKFHTNNIQFDYVPL